MEGVTLGIIGRRVATGEIRQCWNDEIATKPYFLFHLELHQLLLETDNLNY
jgi:hypothetical protein